MDAAGSDADTSNDVLQSVNVDPDEDGFGFRRGEVIALDLDDATLAAASELGFRVVRVFQLDSIGSRVFLLRNDRDVASPEAVRLLRTVAPDADIAPNHVFLAPSSDGAPGAVTAAPPRSVACACAIGMIDTAVNPNHPALDGVRVRQRAFASPQASADTHGTAVASLLFGRETGGARLFVADVFTGQASRAGAATVVIEALEWLSSTNVPVINISMAGPRNAVVDAVIERLIAHGITVVAAVGNDGPAAPPAFPAALSSVVAVTAVDHDRLIYRYAIRGDQVDFAAPGVNVAAAAPSGGYAAFTGTSFAAPIVAGYIARRVTRPDPGGAARAMRQLQQSAVDLGAPGRDRIYGYGLVPSIPE